VIFAALAIGWVFLIVLAPYLPVPAAASLYLFGSRICHQIAERSLHLAGEQLPVCARCVGVYAGAAAAALVAACAARRGVSRRALDGKGGADLRTGLRAGAAGTAVNLATIVVEQMGLWSLPNGVRAAAGAILGAAVVAVVAGAARELHYTRCRSLPPVTPDRRVTPI
jgi:hypothetical protein